MHGALLLRPPSQSGFSGKRVTGAWVTVYPPWNGYGQPTWPVPAYGGCVTLLPLCSCPLWKALVSHLSTGRQVHARGACACERACRRAGRHARRCCVQALRLLLRLRWLQGAQLTVHRCAGYGAPILGPAAPAWPPLWQGAAAPHPQPAPQPAAPQQLPGPRPAAPALPRPSVAGNGSGPAAMAAPSRPSAQQPTAGFVIRPQMGKRKQPDAPAPAYLKVAPQPAPSKPAAGQKSWPPSLRAYVERAFATCTSENKSRLPDALRQVSCAGCSGALFIGALGC